MNLFFNQYKTLTTRAFICLVMAIMLCLHNPLQAAAATRAFTPAPRPSTYTDLAKWTLYTIRNNFVANYVGSATQSLYNYAKRKYYGSKRSLSNYFMRAKKKARPDSQQEKPLGIVGTVAALGTDLYLSTKLNNDWNTQFEGLPALPMSYYGLQYAANYLSSSLYETSLYNWFNATCTPSDGSTWSYAKSIASTAAVVASLYAQYQAPLCINKYFLNKTLESGRFLAYAGMSLAWTGLSCLGTWLDITSND